MALGASTVSAGLVVAAAIFFLVVVGVGLWAVRVQGRQFPKGFDRTGWEPRRGVAGWLATKFAWLAGGRS
ncbi:MAG TPA: hypothetical protein VH572_04965 [Gaiella sp.]|jgi:hypothetical protein